jgi:DNA-binding MarR family transcriptional regulator
MEDRVRNPIQPSLMQELAQALSHADRSVVRQLSPALEAEGCTVPQWRVLVLLADGRGHQMSEIADFAIVPAPTLTRLIDRMATDGLVHRKADMRDGRRVLVYLTRRGRALYRRLDERVQREETAVLADVDAAEAQQLLVLLAALVDRLR